MTATEEHRVQPPALKRRHIAAATIGNALEFYDFLTYAFFSIQIGHAFFPAQSAYGSLMLSLATFGAGFVTRPIGAIVIGAYSDRVGRKPALMLCFMLIGFSILGMALIPTYATIGIAAPILAVLARMLQGFSLGGEIGSTTAFLLEAAPLDRRGLIVAWQDGGQLIALVIGGSMGALLTLILSASALDAYGWRIAFLLGFLAVPFGLWLRTHLPETLHMPEPIVGTPMAPQSRLDQLRSHWRPMALGLTILGSCTIANYIALYMVTYTQNTLHMSARIGFIAATSSNVLSIPSVLLGGWLSDRYGRRPVNACGNLAFLLLIYPMFYWVVATRSPLALILSMTIFAITSNFIVGSFQAGLAESLPKTIRGSGFGTAYSVAIAAFGGTTQLIVTWLIRVTGSAMSPAWYVMGAAAIGQVAIMLMPESAPDRCNRPSRAAIPVEEAPA